MENKKNDWFATLLFQPNMTLQDFANNDITPDNTSINTREYYKNIPEVIDAFKNENGQFDENKFNRFYQSALTVYNDYANNKFENKLLETYEYDPFDYFAPAGSKVKDNLPSIQKVANPERRSAGLEYVFGRGNQTMSFREIAQQNKVFNWETQKFEDWTPNEKGGIWKALNRPTLVLATWDEDGTHVVDGRTLQHKKGDLKFNEDGDTYYETLGNREIYGKQVLGIEDTLTVDGSAWNKYDFFDSDGLDKSLGGTISKLVFKVGPMLIPYVGSVYGALSAGTELAQLIPTLMKSINGIIGGDNDSDFIKKLNQIEGYAARFDSNVSDYSQQNMFSWENLGKMIEDTSLQLFQQRVIGQIPRILTGAPESVRVQKLGRNLALAYMAGTSSQQAYSEFKNAGATDAVAGLGMLSVMGGMYGLMNMDYFRNFLFKGTYLDQNPAKKAVKDLAQEVKENLTKWSVTTPKQAANFIVRGKQFFQNQFAKYSSNELVDSALNEATEEVMEEVTSDLTKALFAAGDALGIDMTESERRLDFGWSASDAAQRYAMSFFGGAIGGPVFQLHGKWQNRLHGISSNLATTSDNQTAQEIVYLIRQGRTDDIRNELARLHKKGKLGDVNLSGKTYELVNTGDETQIKFHNAEEGESQNDVVYDQLLDYIDRVDKLMSSEGLKVSDETLKKLQVYDQEGRPYDKVAEAVLASGVTTQIFSDFNNITEQIVRKSAELSKLNQPTPNTPITNETQKAIAEQNAQNLEIQKLNQEINNLRARRDAILNGERTGYYFGQAIFATNSAINQAFVNMGLHDYVKTMYGKDLDLLNEDLQKTAKENFSAYTQLDEKAKVYKAYDLFLNLSQQLKDSLLKINDETKVADNIYGLRYSTLGRIANNLDAINAKIEELKSNEEKNSEEINRLISEKEILQNIQKQYTENTALLIANPISTEGQDILHRPISSTTTDIDSYAQSILNFYSYLKNNNLSADFGDLDVLTLLRSVKKQQDENSLSYKQRYITWLQNLYKNNPDLELMGNPVSFDYSITGYENFNNLLDELQASLDEDPEQVLSKFAEIRNQLEQTDLDENQIEDFFNYVFPRIGTYRLDEYLNEYYNIRSQVKASPIYELLNVFAISLGRQPSQLLNIIANEHNKFIASKNIKDYIIQDKNAKTQLEQLLLFLKGIKSILNASVDFDGEGINNSINKYLGNLSLPEIDFETFYNLSNDIELLENKLNILLEVSQKNQEQKARVQKDITINMKQLFVNSLTNENSLIKQRVFDMFHINLNEIWNKYKPTEEVTEENFNTFEDSAIKFETEVFETIYEQKLTNDDLANKLIALFDDKELYKQKSTDLNTNNDNIITDYDVLMYLASIIITPSQNFYAALKPIISSDEFDKIPIFSQEHAVRIGYAMNYNKELFNKIINSLVPSDPNLSDYIKNKLKLYNFYCTFGGAGTGKTTAVGYLLKTLFNETSSFISLAPTSEQASKLATSIKADNSKIFNKADFIKAILGRELTTDDYELHNDYITLKDFIIPKVTSLFDNTPNKILFIDEISHFTRPELELISNWAITNNVMVYAFGDKKQDSSIITINSKTVVGGIEDTYLIKSPNLTATLRPNNIAKNDNYITLNAILEKGIKYYEDNPDIDSIQLSNHAKSYWNSGIKLEYYENNNTFVGEKIVDTNDQLLDYINKLSHLSNDIAIITDNPKKYTGLPQNAKVINLDAVQGSEFDYVVIDKEWRNKAQEWGTLRNLYTLTQRSTLGSVILDSDKYLRNTLNITTQFDETVNNNIEIKQNDIDAFKNWRLRSLLNIESNPVYSNLTYEPEFSTPETPIAQTTIDKDQKENQPTVVNTPIDKSQKSEPTIANSDIGERNLNETQLSSQNTVPSGEISLENAIEDTVSETNLESKPKVYSKIDESTFIVKSAPLLRPSNTDITIESDLTLDWFTNNLWDYDVNENDKSIYKQFEFRKSIPKSKYIQYVYRLSNYFLHGHHKTHNQTKNRLEISLNQLAPSNRNKNKAIVNSLQDAKLKIVPYNRGKQGLLVADISINDNKRIRSVRIPILLTINSFGDYNGDIKMVQDITYDSDGIVNRDVYNLNANNYFTILPYYITFVVKDEELDSIKDERTRTVAKAITGKAMGLISSDLMLNSMEFKKDMHPTLDSENNVTYLVQSDARFVLFGVQQVKQLSEIITDSRAKIAERQTALDQAKKLGEPINKVYAEYAKQKHQVVYTTRAGQITTEILNLAKSNSGIRKTLFNNLRLHITKERDNQSNRTPRESSYKNVPGIMFTLNYLNKDSGQNEVKSFLVKQEYDQFVLYSLDNKKIKSIDKKITSVSSNSIDNLYLLIEKLGDMYELNFREYIDPKTLQTYLVRYNYQRYIESNGAYKWVPVNSVWGYTASETLDALSVGIENLDVLNDIITTSSLFKNGIYAQDHRTEEPIAQYIFGLTDPRKDYKVDISKFHGPIYAIDKTQIIKTSIQQEEINQQKEQVEQLNRFNTFLKENNLSPETSLDINQNIEKINDRLKRLTNDITYSQIEIDSITGEYRLITVKDMDNLIKNKLENANLPSNNFVRIQDNPTYTLNFIPFYISLQNETSGYTITKINNKWELLRFDSFNSYKQMYEYFISIKDIIPSNIRKSITNYLSDLFSNKEISAETANMYYQIFKQPELLGENLLILDEYVQNYLLERLKNNEC